jgi:hypothetical protein
MYVSTKDKVLCHNLRKKKCVLVIKIFFFVRCDTLISSFCTNAILIYIYIYVVPLFGLSLFISIIWYQSQMVRDWI